jgi:hypothetical protein
MINGVMGWFELVGNLDDDQCDVGRLELAIVVERKMKNLIC